MKVLAKGTLLNLLCLLSFSANADLVENQYNPLNPNKSTDAIAKYILNLGAYLGYDLSKGPSDNKAASQELLDATAILVSQSYVFNTFLGARPVDAITQALSLFIPNNAPGGIYLNQLANATFKLQSYQSPSQEGMPTFSVTPLIDQQAYQKDPVSQAVLNILGTPDLSVCMDYDGVNWDVGCKFLYQNKVMANVIGPFPNKDKFYSYDYNQDIISQLNSNSLIGPLMYSIEDAGVPISADKNKSNMGLSAVNQVQEAGNFVRYVTGSVSPITLPKVKAYDSLYNKAYPAVVNPLTPPTPEQLQAQGILGGYFTSLRVFAAQSSVGIGNLYYLMSKRLPQNQGGSDNSILSSQAMSEFKMATWRLFNADKPSKQWLEGLNAASPATVEKEIAALLAEINYQMYLDRQIQERILLTQSVLLMQNTRASEPTADFDTTVNDGKK